MDAASPSPCNPSDALAGVAAAMMAFEPADFVAWKRELTGMRPSLEAPEDWRSDAEYLCRRVRTALGGSWPPQPPRSAVSFVKYAYELQTLDRWHEALFPAATDLPRSDEHEKALDRLATIGRYNEDRHLGLVLPREAPDSPFFKIEDELDLDANPSSFAVVNSLLGACAYLPPTIVADDPDDEHLKRSRTLDLDFQRFPSGLIRPREFRDDVRIAIAPALEATTDATLWTEGDRYSIHPQIAANRLEKILNQAIEEEADLLLLPEMSVDEDLLPAFQTAIVEERRRFYRSKRRLPRLALAICGVLRKRDRSSVHRNYIATIDSDGNVLFAQDKLSHWNLGKGAQRRFGIPDTFPVPLLEDTVPGSALTIAELPGFGRVITLICADMSADEPGDWIADNIGLDWVHAPIMDGSTCWTQKDTPWIISRAERTARSGSAVIVTNSMTLTHWNNAVISREARLDPSYPYMPYSTCGIALAMLPEGKSIRMQHITAPLRGSKSPIVRVIDWSDRWTFRR